MADTDKKKKKGALSALWESMTKTGGCCGAGETCGGAPQPDNSKKKTEPKEKVKVNDERG